MSGGMAARVHQRWLIIGASTQVNKYQVEVNMSKCKTSPTAILKLNDWELFAIEKALELIEAGIVDTWSLNRLQEKIKQADTN